MRVYFGHLSILVLLCYAGSALCSSPSEENRICQNTDSSGACMPDDVSLLQTSAKIAARGNSSSQPAVQRKVNAKKDKDTDDNVQNPFARKRGFGRKQADSDRDDDDEEDEGGNDEETEAEMKDLNVTGNMSELAKLGEKYLMEHRAPWHNARIGMVIAITMLILVVLQITCVVHMETTEGYSSPDELRRGEVLIREPEPLEASTYTLAIVTIIRDVYNLKMNITDVITTYDDKRNLRILKIMFAMGLAFATSIIQIVLVYCTKHFVTPLQVENIQLTYENFEKHMYLGGKYHPQLFASLTFYEKHQVCQIPLSQPTFLAVLLLVWTVTCLSKIKQCGETFIHVCLVTPTVDSMAESLAIHCNPNAVKPAEPVVTQPTEATIDTGEETGLPIRITTGLPTVLTDQARITSGAMAEHAAGLSKHVENTEEVVETAVKDKMKLCAEAEDYEISEDDTRCIVLGLTLRVKIFVTALLTPWLLTTIFALWLGCRWLVATADFPGLIGNCVALEFILHIEEMLFYSWVTDHHKREMDSILFVPQRIRERLGWFVAFNGISWALTALCWVYAYMWYFQKVLPHYRWDVERVCSPWLQAIIDKPTPPFD